MTGNREDEKQRIKALFRDLNNCSLSYRAAYPSYGSFGRGAFYVVDQDVFYIIPQALLRGFKTLKITPNGKYEEFRENWDFSTGKIRYERD